jgi:hypothetical protein
MNKPKSAVQKKLKASDMKKVKGGIFKHGQCARNEVFVEYYSWEDEYGNWIVEGQCERRPDDAGDNINPLADD